VGVDGLPTKTILKGMFVGEQKTENRGERAERGMSSEECMQKKTKTGRVLMKWKIKKGQYMKQKERNMGFYKKPTKDGTQKTRNRNRRVKSRGKKRNGVEKKDGKGIEKVVSTEGADERQHPTRAEEPQKGEKEAKAKSCPYLFFAKEKVTGGCAAIFTQGAPKKRA